jgi:Cu+-exporting ATPase
MPFDTNNLATELAVTGMTCGNCARHVTEAIQNVPGVRSASASLDTSRVLVRWVPGSEHSIPALIQAIENEGYGAKVIAADEPDRGQQRLAGWHVNLVIAILGTVPLMIGEWVFNLGMNNMPWFRWFSFVLAGIVQVFAGAQFYRGAWNQLKVLSFNMDALVALGSTTAFGFSVWGLFSGYTGHLYFLESASIIMLISVGHWIESRVSVRASDALRKLLNLAPEIARRKNPDGSETEVPLTELQIGNLIALRPGDRVPTDGQVAEGDSAVDEAMLTGESAPVDKSAGSELYAGTVNLNGRLVMRVTAMGEETALAHIIASVQRAQTSRANIQRLGDRVSSVFVPVVVLIALTAGLWWGLEPESAQHVHNWLGQFLWHTHLAPAAAGFIIAAAVLIIACPCAMGLATPAAIMAGSNAAARRGILIRDGVALEKAGKISAVIFDKTGTLTIGKPEVAAIGTPKSSSTRFESNAVRADQQPGAPIALAATLARHSSHPISQAIAKLTTKGVEISDWKEIRGAGIEGTLRDPTFTRPTRLRLGSLRWLRESGVDLVNGENFITEWSASGATIVGLANESELVCLFAIKDTVKSGAVRVIDELHRQDFKTYLVTGDNALTAASIAKQTGIKPENVFAEVRPEQKSEFVKKLQEQGERVAFVGDGINDAPALARLGSRDPSDHQAELVLGIFL